MIYLDNASTTRPCEEAVQAAEEIMREDFFNPSALYFAGARVRGRIESARETVAGKLGAAANEVVFTSGATEANNWAVNCGYKNRKGNAVVSLVEHPSVYETAVALKNKGLDVRFVRPGADGCVHADDLVRVADEKTAFVSILHVSNETGAVNDIAALVRAVKGMAPRAVFHSDGVQAFGKIPVDVRALGVDLYSVSAHKIGGPKGVGALIKRVPLAPFITGGGQENGARSGTENTAGIAGFGAAAGRIGRTLDRTVFEYARNALAEIPGVHVNTPPDGSGYILSASVIGIRSEILQHMLSDEGIFIGLGSACSSKKSGNRVLSAMGLDDKYIAGNIRLSFCPDTRLDEVKAAIVRIRYNIEKLRGAIGG